MKRRVITLLLVTIILGVFTGCGNASKDNAVSGENGTINGSEEGQTSDAASSEKEELSQYDFVGVARYGSLPVGVSFLLPERDGAGDVHVTMHGTSHFGVRRNIWIDTLLAETDVSLEEIPVKLQQEYKEEKYEVDIDHFTELTDTSWFMGEGDISTMPELAFAKTKNVKIGEIEAFYFETDIYLDSSKTVGYSFFFDEKPICIYTELMDFEKEEVKKTAEELEWYIASMKSYSGESFMELDSTSNFSSHIYDGYSNFLRFSVEEMDAAGKKLFAMNLPWQPGMNQDKMAVDIQNKFFPEITAENALETIAASEEWRHVVSSLSYYDPQKYELDILKKENVTVNGFDFTRYVCQLKGEYQKVFVMYTMVFEDLLYAFEYAWECGYSPDPAAENYLSPEQVDTLIKTLEYSALSSINTIRTVQTQDEVMIYTNFF